MSARTRDAEAERAATVVYLRHLAATADAGARHLLGLNDVGFAEAVLVSLTRAAALRNAADAIERGHHTPTPVR